MKKFLFGFVILFIITGCSGGKITDKVTEELIHILEPGENHYIFQTLHFGMEQKNHDYVHQELIFDLSYYNEHHIHRGDVVLFKLTEAYKNTKEYPFDREKDISRVIALPGEKVSVKHGQIYINDKKLDTFYGKLKYKGFSDPKPLFAALNACEKECQESIKSFLRLNMDEIEVPPDHVFLLGDNSQFAIDSRDVGPIPIDRILGKFLGYAKEEKVLSIEQKSYNPN